MFKDIEVLADREEEIQKLFEKEFGKK